MAQRSKVRVISRSLAGIASSNPGGGILLCVLYNKGQKAKPRQLRQRSTDKVQRRRMRFYAPVQTGPGAHLDAYKMYLAELFFE